MKRTIIVMTVLLSLILTACGAAGPSTTINVTMTDFQFTPNTFIVPAGQEITINSTNNGTVVHNFVIMNFGTTAGNKFDDDDLVNIFWQVEIQPGGDNKATFTAPAEPGEYQIVCRTEGHLEAGMIGKLTVVPPESEQ